MSHAETFFTPRWTKHGPNQSGHAYCNNPCNSLEQLEWSKVIPVLTRRKTKMKSKHKTHRRRKLSFLLSLSSLILLLTAMSAQAQVTQLPEESLVLPSPSPTPVCNRTIKARRGRNRSSHHVQPARSSESGRYALRTQARRYRNRCR